MAYSEKVIDHYQHPRNVGSFGTSKDVAARRDIGVGIVGAPECGDVMQLQLRISEEGIIEEAKFKCFGCGSAIASSSLATEWIKGKSIEEALTIRNTQIVEELSLPPVKIHCSVLAEDSIRSAIADFQKKNGIVTATAETNAAAH
ncbi:MAG: Fe-S cluster assembly scaffold IscU [Phycisphaerales bacterium]|nr:Fe-S cluster assembly scaffold IscU [Phycisphaerales bacterium]